MIRPTLDQTVAMEPAPVVSDSAFQGRHFDSALIGEADHR